MDRDFSLRFDLDLNEALGRRLHPDAIVVQEDRNLVMAKQSILDLEQHNGLGAAYLAMAEHRPIPLGRYLLLRNPGDEAYWTYQAVVHDLEAKPSCRAGNVRRALTGVLKDSVKRSMTSLAVEPLGVWRSRGLEIEEMVEAFETAVLDVSVGLGGPLRVTLLLDDMVTLEEVSHLLRSRLLRKACRSFRTVDGEAALVEMHQRGFRLHCRFVPGSLSGYAVTCMDETD
ncbi:MAG: hypothetical protein PVG92_06385 [Holophagae bacterium]